MDPASHGLRESATFDRATIHAIQRAAGTSTTAGDGGTNWIPGDGQ
ncbi:hypothetical protein [Streptomyces sp. 6N223]